MLVFFQETLLFTKYKQLGNWFIVTLQFLQSNSSKVILYWRFSIILRLYFVSWPFAIIVCQKSCRQVYWFFVYNFKLKLELVWIHSAWAKMENSAIKNRSQYSCVTYMIHFYYVFSLWRWIAAFLNCIIFGFQPLVELHVDDSKIKAI